MAYKPWIERHPDHLMFYANEEGEPEPWRSPAGCFCNWSADWSCIELFSPAKKEVVKYPCSPLTGVVREKPWKA